MLQAAAPEIYVDPAIVAYAVAITTATRDPALDRAPGPCPYIAFGASPRGSINLVHAARALALLRGRRYVVPADIAELAPDVLRHRIVPSFSALAEEVTAGHAPRPDHPGRPGAAADHGAEHPGQRTA